MFTDFGVAYWVDEHNVTKKKPAYRGEKSMYYVHTEETYTFDFDIR